MRDRKRGGRHEEKIKKIEGIRIRRERGSLGGRGMEIDKEEEKTAAGDGEREPK